MPPVYHVKFLPEGRVAPFSISRRNVYALPEGIRLSMCTDVVWCRHCRCVTEGEQIDSLQKIDQHLADLNNPSSKICSMFANFPDRDDFLQSMREDAVHRRRWREARSAPPKCTRCGSTAIFAAPIGEPFANPDAPGTVEIQVWCIYTENYGEDSYRYFTPEGDRLPCGRDAAAQ